MDQHTTEGSTMGIEYARVTNERKEAPAIERLMTADEVAAALGVSRKFVYARAAEGALPSYKLGARYRFRPADVRAFLQASLESRDTPRRRRSRRPAPAGSFRDLLDRTTA
jgi:excisionase family DNA binding protein